MRHLLRAYGSLLHVAWAMMFQYRAEMVIWTVWGLIHPLVALAVWSAAARSGAIGGFERGDFAAYFLVLTMSWDSFEFSWLVQTGRMSAKLLRPLHPVHEAVAYNIAYKAMMLLLLVPAWLMMLWALDAHAHPRWWHVVLTVPTLFLAAVIRFTWNSCLAMLAFWVVRVDAIHQLYWSLDMFLGGRLAPLALMPGFLRLAATYAPFRSMTVFPLELALGYLDGRQIAEGMALQVVWLAVGYGLFRLLWRAGIRQYSAVGA